jgi:hypothetical protein
MNIQDSWSAKGVSALMVLVLAFGMFPGAAFAATMLSDSFGTGGDDNNISGWDESDQSFFFNDDDVYSRAGQTSGEDSTSPDGGRFAKIGDGEWMCREIDADGYFNLTLSFYWRGDADAEGDDFGIVEYRENGSCNSSNWTTIASHDMSNDSSWTTVTNLDLPAVLDNQEFFIRFRTNASQNDEYFRVDGVVIAETITDTTPPTIPQHADMTVEATGPSGAVATFSVVATDNVAPLSFNATCSPASGSMFALGETTVTCDATDTAGNAATAMTFKVNVQDTTKPVITLNGNAAINLVVGDTYTEEGATASDTVDTNVPVTIGGDTVNTAVPGIYTITYNATDDAGNAATQKTRSVTVSDVVAPVITTPGNITEEATGPSGNVVTYIVTATDDVGVVSVSCNPVSGSLFAITTTPVNCTANDAANNVKNEAFSVTVQDTTAPVVTIVPSEFIETTDSNGTIAYFTASATDVVDSDVAIVCDAVSGGLFPIGGTTVTCTGTDDFGNVGTAQATITIGLSSASGGGTSAVSLCSDGLDNDGDTLTDWPLDTDCAFPFSESEGEVVEETTTTETSTEENTGGSTETAEVLEATEEPLASEVLGVSCSAPLANYLGFGDDNADDVKFVQGFLNNEMGSTLDVNGIYDAATKAVVMAFQLKYWEEILAPWVPFGLSADEPTGIVYKTTQRMIHMLSCPGTEIPMPELP